MAVATALTRRLALTGDEVVGGVALLSLESVFLLAYLLVAPGASFAPRFLLLLLVPVVWLNVSLFAVHRTRRRTRQVSRPATRGGRVVAGVVALGYFVVLAGAGGVLQPGIGDLATGLRVVTTSIPPGWAPAVLYSGERVVVNLVFYQTVGYLTLAYLVYASVLDASGGLVAGLLGLLSCVSCSLPLVAGLVGGLLGGAGALASAASAQSYGLSTVVFVVTVALLAWRPSMADVSRLRAKVGV